MPTRLPTVLEGIVTARRTHLADIRARISHVDPATLPRSTRSLYRHLGGGEQGSAARANRFIMECKSSSPSLGVIREHYEPGAIAAVYSRYASGISVLCEPERFGGDYDHLATVAATTHLPVLCKDFIIDPVQIHAARYFGADAILLMLSILDDDAYAALAAEAARLGMDVLTEIIDEDEVARALRLGAQIVGINHRNLHDLSIDLSRSRRLAALLPGDVVVVSESGIRDRATVSRLGSHSHAFLVGSQLTGQPDIDRAARRLVFGENKVCGLTRPSAAQAARAAGAVYGGLIFEEASPRHVSRETARAIITAEPGLDYVAVSRRTDGWAKLIEGIDVTAVQLHAPYRGSSAGERALLDSVRADLDSHGRRDVRIWRAVSMTHPDADATARYLAALAGEPGDEERGGLLDRLVLDSGAGGTGRAFDWARVPAEARPISLLAGGLHAENLDRALAVGCAGMDLNSGVEYGPESGPWAGHKDAAALRRAFLLIRSHSSQAPEEGK
ncbi:bifunctional indole-3-glycerol-phosphate synthase TrpC/phosphoribosylanthranilate isomerase TrpF [Corynebacterium sp. zg-331]|uniref:bifunctional indole-3-glycerol-phosphate synthase TrpC/phosphoribosylanthranilate isomerase TrpF n=1 Tax=unclassified Corynebacterium TaxID=2624378 RepID=UPI00128B571A|nr:MULTISPECIES: bifunctional indole-3-glycerol-phosphate synthase TrpC/phosphoribosylanthranilate isomerase TrpF [unclassified Corynebacterium]MBC3186505.1 bifunctional indole-3-glycerol-phosphate synthase TrpC/phosphoribosylanthranilate isomerase TrpF [Corynebacterium sp. zg-331]MPV52990.1 bifunctional indole-3-glycerol-phosphate synthase TrpC/phosphoribosylanthranilate isomerase TrpF [Corynebacterium sp. zg331]